MKSISLRDGDPFKTRDVLKAIIAQPSPGRGIDVGEMRKRMRLDSALEAARGEVLHLEDADHALLVQLVNAFQFGTAHPQLLAIIDDVIEAKAPPAVAAE